MATGHSHSHGGGGHDHSHHHHAGASETVLLRAFLLIAGFMGVEAVAGILTNSLVLIADAGHMFLDATALGLAWYSLRLSRREQDDKLSYGYHRYQVLAAFVNALSMLALVAWILIEAVERLQEPQGLLPVPMLIVAALGLAVNLLAFYWLHGKDDNAAVRSALLHVLGDLLGSVAAIASGIVIYLTGWTYADPLLALLVAAILLRGTWRVLRESSNILLEGVPAGLNLDDVRRVLSTEVAGVTAVHHLHAWALTPERPLLTLHADIEPEQDAVSVVASLKAVLTERFGIDHSTIQVEYGDCLDHADTGSNHASPHG
jgi:cobalt-zinc-cadmium efflux system protein